MLENVPIILKIVDFLRSFFLGKAKIDAKVLDIRYSLVKNEPNSGIVVITLHPSDYIVKMGIANIGEASTSITNIELEIEKKFKIQPDNFKYFMLGAGEYKEIEVFFPVDELKAIRNGKYTLKIFTLLRKPVKLEEHF